jgi:hypothetical protein
MSKLIGINRKKLAGGMGVFVKTLIRYERELGLDKIRLPIPRKPFLYDRDKAPALLRKQGIILEDSSRINVSAPSLKVNIPCLAHNRNDEL